VARAYRGLESEGLLVSRRGGGTRVASTPPTAAKDRQQRLAELTASYVARARALGASDADIRQSLGLVAGPADR
jgi:DNA-binding transcriptional regulator YhcF (GntR family)